MTDEKDRDPGKLQGSIDIVGLFEAEAQRLLGALEHGRLLHRTKNIRDSGAPFETALRAFFEDRVPTPFEVMHGYLFDIESNCTPQIDAMIVHSHERHELMVSPEGAGYVPFTSARVIFEFKNSANNIEKHLDQIAKISESVRQMASGIRQRGGRNGEFLHDPMTVLIVGDSTGLNPHDLKGYTRVNLPTYTLLLDRGVIIASRSAISELMEFDAGTTGAVGFYEHRGASQPTACICEGTSPQGKGLLWIYFALMAFVNLTEGNRSNFLSFTNDAMLAYPLRPIASLENLSDWASFEAAVEEMARRKESAFGS